MADKFTPGPWVAESTVNRGCAIIASKEIDRISNPSRGIVARAEQSVGQTNAQVKANARLIAAAPELVAALRECADELDDVDFCGARPTAYSAVIYRARALLARIDKDAA